MKGLFAVLIWFLLFSPTFGQEMAIQKHPEQEWNFLFTNINGKDDDYKGFSFAKSNYSKTQYLGLSFCDLNKPEIKKTEGFFSIEREIDYEVKGVPFKDTIKIDGREEVVEKINRYVLGLDLRFLPEKLRTKANSVLFKNIEAGLFWGGGAEINVEVKTQKTTLYFQQDGGNQDDISIPSIPTSITFDWGPYFIFGAFGSIGRLTASLGIKRVYCPQNNQLSFASTIGVKF